MLETTLCYIEKDEMYLMLHRIKKKNDLNQGKWIGVGGKFEQDESPDECMRREIKEETDLDVISYRYCGIVTFVSDQYETEYMHLFTIQDFTGSIKDCEEGVLEWIPKNTLSFLPHWDGDLIFLSLILDKARPFFSLKLVYQGDYLVRALLDGKRAFVTSRLLLIPLKEETVWTEKYAVIRHDTDEVIGNAGLVKAGETTEEFLAKGWIREEFQAEGYLEEALQALRNSIEDLK
jgi:8-oxo-dGTP diphosphatase